MFDQAIANYIMSRFVVLGSLSCKEEQMYLCCRINIKCIHHNVKYVCNELLLNLKVDVLKSGTYLIWSSILSDMWLGVAPRTDTKKTCVQKKLDYVPKI